MVSEICKAFGCTPAEALEQDYELVTSILEARTAQDAVDLFTLPPGATAKDAKAHNKRAFEILAASKSMLLLLANMPRTQMGKELLVDQRGKAAQDEGVDVAKEHFAKTVVEEG